MAGGTQARMSIIPAAAAPDNNHHHAGQQGVKWFKELGAANVCSLPLIDYKSANDADVVKALRQSKIIYLLGGFPRHLAQSLAGSESWTAILAAHQSGAIIAGSSAGAMVLGDQFYDPYEKKLLTGLGLIAGACILPHHNTFGRKWAPALAKRLSHVLLIGIDEETGLLNDDPDGKWRIHGAGGAVLYKNHRQKYVKGGRAFDLVL
jgi:cyanophycinase